MPPNLSPEAWAQIRRDYEHTDRPVEAICAQYGISSGTLRDRMRRWGWTRRRAPIPPEGPPPAPPIETAPPPPPAAPVSETAPPALACAVPVEAAAPPGAAEPQAAFGDAGEPDLSEEAIVPCLQRAVARVLPAIEATLARLAANTAHPREMERAARALAALTRTLRELNGLLRQHAADRAASGRYTPAEVEEMRHNLARKLEALINRHREAPDDGDDEWAWP